MKVERKIIEIDEELCDGCGNCVPSCAEGALAIVDGKARLVAEVYCDGLGACLGECPTGALQVVTREAEEFDEEAVEEYLKSKEEAHPAKQAQVVSSCPSAQLSSFAPACDCAGADRPAKVGGTGSALSHWPIQIRLIPPTAPFLRGADLLVAADCTPVAYPDFHSDFLKGRKVLIGCPKFDNAQEYIQRFAEIFKAADIHSVTVVVMEVPCCSGLPLIVERGMEKAGKKIPMEKIVISAGGEILKKEKLAA